MNEELFDSSHPAHVDQCKVKIPRFLKVTTRKEDNDLETVRTKLRVNKIFHTKFNPSLENSEGQRYYEGVY
jgi:hypothetical protein